MGLNSANKVDNNKYELEISVDKEKFQDAVSKIYKKNVGKMNVPGFRKGKAPRSVVEKLYGESVFFEDAVNLIYPEAYGAAVDEAAIEPVDRAEVEILSVSKDGFTFKATVTVKPEVEVGQYKGLKAEKTVKEVTEEDVNAELERVRSRNARIVSVEDRPALMGDMTVIDFDGSLDGVPFDGGKAEKHSLELGSGQFIPGFEEQVVGHTVGEEFDVNVSFPEDYQVKELAGKAALFKVKLHEIKYRELPTVDDEFAKDVSEFDTLEEYKKDIEMHITEKFEAQAEEAVENDLMDQVIAGMTADIPQAMFEHSIDGFVNDFDYRLQAQGLNVSTYLQYTGMEMESFRKTFREQAEKQVKFRLALEKIASLENFEATAEDIDTEYEKLATRYGVEVDRVKEAIPAKDVTGDIIVSKAVDLIHSSAEITTVGAQTEAPKKSSRKSKKSDDAQ